MLDLHRRKLLLMGGGIFAQSLKRYQDEQGFQIFAVGNNPSAAASRVADKYYNIDTHDIEAVIRVIKAEKIDGIFAGATEANIIPAIKVAEATGAHFFTNRYLWDLTCNKSRFKALLATAGIEVVPEYTVEEVKRNPSLLPVIIKPDDGSGAYGISVCYHLNEIDTAIEKAKSNSWSGNVIIEKYLNGYDDLFVHYTIIDGRVSLTAAFDRHLDYSQGGCTGMALAYSYPSKHLNRYLDNVDRNMREVLRSIGFLNGAINLQIMTDGTHFFFYEAGWRLGGEQLYYFTEKLTGINVFNMVINQALTGKMAGSSDVLDLDEPRFSKPCLNLYVPLKPGRITVMRGVDEVRLIPGVLNVTEMCGVGTMIEPNGSLGQVCLRMHLMRNTIAELNETLDMVYKALVILDENGNDMLMTKYRCENVKAINE